MATMTMVVGTRTSLTVTNLNSAAAGEYNHSAAINCTTNDPLDIIIEATFTPVTTPAGNKQVVVFALGSLDGTNYETGPADESTTTTNEPDMTYVGTVPINDTGAHTGLFSLAAAFGGVLPQYVKIVTKNDQTIALAASGNTVYYSEVTGASA